MSGQYIHIRRVYVEECERFWKEAPVKWTHNKLTNSKTLTSVADAKSYIDLCLKGWELNLSERNDRLFINNLYCDCEQACASATEHSTAQYVSGSQQGTCKYILVIVNNNNGKITVGYAYHDIKEDMRGSNCVYREYDDVITKHWLKLKSIESLREILPSNAVPSIIWE
ncbi:unnamed protein product [Rotaria magnacalcarata]|nr:unnamed protein product [Rotaria magnacalcarata]CAF1319899.1 unnamed protein product [Rotaria magnacalcarata]CAF2047766.1 unnamed protein product [Rotaria magnacalcarata]